MEGRIPLLLVAVLGVPLAIVAYISLAEYALRAVPRRRRPALRPWLWLAPALALVGTYLIYPTLRTIVLSFHDARGERFVGLDNYQWLVTSDVTLSALRNNVAWIVVFTSLVLIIGLLLAVLGDRVRYERLAKSLVFLPMAISFVAAGVIWKFMYDYRPPGEEQTGTLNAVVTAFGGEPRAWLIDAPVVNNFALIMVAVWVWTGFAMVILSASLKGISAELLEASRVDGASEAQVFRHITLPLLMPTITVIATTLVIFALKAFDVVYVMTNGNFDTEVVANRMYKELFNSRNFGRAAVISVMLLLATIPILAFNLRRFRTQPSGALR